MKHSSENSEFRRLKHRKLLSDPDADYNRQPTSGGLMDGPLGKQEYGIESQPPPPEELPEEDEEEPGENVGPPDEVDAGLEPEPVGEVDDGFPGLSEYANEQRSSRHIEQEADLPDLPPKGDQAVQALIDRRLREHPAISIDEQTVEVHDGTAEISGLVASNAMKLRAEEIAEAIPGVRSVVNRLRDRMG